MTRAEHKLWIKGYRQAIEALKVKGTVETMMQLDGKPYEIAADWLEQCLPIVDPKSGS